MDDNNKVKVDIELKGDIKPLDDNIHVEFESTGFSITVHTDNGIKNMALTNLFDKIKMSQSSFK